MTQWLKIRPTLLPEPAIELVMLARRVDGLYKRSLACYLTDLQNEGGFSAQRLSSTLSYLASLQLHKVDDREAEIELEYSYVGAMSELILSSRDCIEASYWQYAQSQ